MGEREFHPWLWLVSAFLGLDVMQGGYKNEMVWNY